MTRTLYRWLTCLHPSPFGVASSKNFFGYSTNPVTYHARRPSCMAPPSHCCDSVRAVGNVEVGSRGIAGAMLVIIVATSQGNG
jgi:hypothetical protein